MGGSLNLIGCLKELMKIKAMFKFNNFPITKKIQGDLTPIIELIVDGIQKE